MVCATNHWNQYSESSSSGCSLFECMHKWQIFGLLHVGRNSEQTVNRFVGYSAILPLMLDVGGDLLTHRLAFIVPFHGLDVVLRFGLG